MLALDFDGVVCDSFREVLATALATYEIMTPESRLVTELRARVGVGCWHALDLATDPIAPPFEALVPLGNRAEDFGVALRAIENGAVIDDQRAYDAYFVSIDRSWMRDFHRSFYDQRASARVRDLDGWIGLHAGYTPFLNLLRRHAGDLRVAIATARDGRSAQLLLDHLGVDDIVDPMLILDKETGVSKTAHLAAIQDRAGVSFSEITFVDDKVNHLVRVAPLGVRPVLAGWGFNGEREHETARTLGFAVANFGNAERVLYGGGRHRG